MSIKKRFRTAGTVALVLALAVGGAGVSSAADPVTTLTITAKTPSKCYFISCNRWLESVTFKTNVNQVMTSIRNINKVEMLYPHNGAVYRLIMQYDTTTTNSTINSWTWNAGNVNGLYKATLTTKVIRSGYVLSRSTYKVIDVPQLA